jgi:phosphatidylglycerophosphate synthase
MTPIETAAARARSVPTSALPTAVLLVVPGTSGVSAERQIAGVPLVRRIALAAERAGFGRVAVVGDAPTHLLDGTVAVPLERAIAEHGRHRLVFVSTDAVSHPDWLRELRTVALEPGRLHVDAGTAAVIETDAAGSLLAAMPAGATLDGIATALAPRRDAGDLRGGGASRLAEGDSRDDASAPSGVAGATAVTRVERPLAPEARFRLATPADVRRAEAWLRRRLIKQNEGFMSRHFERRISLSITRLLTRTGVTPNVMTLVSVGIGLAGAPCFLSSAPAWQLTGALLFLLHSIVDGCDGELARLKFLESRTGAMLDFWGDNVVHVAIFGSIGIGWSLAAHAAWPLVVGAVSVASTLATAAVVSRSFMHDVPAAGRDSLRGRLLTSLSHRDFIYVVIALSAFGKASWFLVVSAIGTPLFLAVLLLSGVRTGARPPR